MYQTQKVMAQHSDFPDLAVQYGKDGNTVGVGICERPTIEGEPPTHPLTMLYGDDTTLMEIGRLFSEVVSHQFTVDLPNFVTNDHQDEWYRNLGKTVLDSVGNSRPDADSWWTWLNRPAVNRLIRLLRTARDSAFGADA